MGSVQEHSSRAQGNMIARAAVHARYVGTRASSQLVSLCVKV